MSKTTYNGHDGTRKASGTVQRLLLYIGLLGLGWADKQKSKTNWTEGKIQGSPSDGHGNAALSVKCGRLGRQPARLSNKVSVVYGIMAITGIWALFFDNHLLGTGSMPVFVEYNE